MSGAPPHPPRVRVLVVNYNSGRWLARCLESLRMQTMPEFEVVLVDNASTDESAYPTLPDRRFRRIALPHNLGFAAGNNLAARDAVAPWLALLNPDAIAAPNWLDCLLEEARRHPDYSIFGSTQFRAGTATTMDGSGDCLSLFGVTWRAGYGRPVPAVLAQGPVLAACGAAMMIRRDWFERLGGFEERLFCYVEDVDLCLRARLQGAQVWQSALAQIQHVGGASTESGTSVFSLYHGNRNLIWVLTRCLPMPWLALSLPGSVAWTLLRSVLKRGSLAQRAAMLTAVRDGLAGLPATWRERAAIQSGRTVDRREVLRWLSTNPIDALFRRSFRIAPKKNARP